jgi:hypothetical protein
MENVPVHRTEFIGEGFLKNLQYLGFSFLGELLLNEPRRVPHCSADHTGQEWAAKSF